jgi:hypothetical protein
MMRRLAVFFLLVVAAFSQAVLEDFSTGSRRTGNNGLLPHIYEGEEGGQTEAVESQAFKVTGGTSGDAGIYWYWLSGPPYTFANNGYTQHWIKSGTWSANYNRLGLRVMCTSTIDSELQLGTFVRDKSQTDSTNAEIGGGHFYHLFDFTLYANQWMWMEISGTPQHQRAYDPNLNWNNNPAGGGNYMDVLTSWYWDTQGTGPWSGKTCYFDDITVWEDTGKPPEEYVSSAALTWNGSNGYKATWSGPKNMDITFDVRYSASKIRTIGWSAASDAGTASNPGDAYTGTEKVITISQQPNFYVAVRPRMNVTSVSGGTPITINTGRGHFLTTGMQVSVNNVCANANGTRTVTVVDRDTVTLDGTSGTCTYSSGGDIRTTSDTEGFYEITLGPNIASGGTAPTISTGSLPNGTVGAAYSQTLSASGDTPITWSVTGSLPAGLSLNTSTGAITGTPTTPGASSFTITATNAAGSDDASLSITISGSQRTRALGRAQVIGGAVLR